MAKVCRWKFVEYHKHYDVIPGRYQEIILNKALSHEREVIEFEKY